MELTWKQHSDSCNNTGDFLHYYDCGPYIGFLHNEDWVCYHILSRKTNEDGNIVEIVEPMPEDWVPYDVYSIEKLELYEKNGSVIKVKGWFIDLPLQVQGQHKSLRTYNQPHTYNQGHTYKDPRTYTKEQQGQPRSQQRQGPPQGQEPQSHEQRPPYPQPYHQPHTSYSQQKRSSQRQQRIQDQQPKELTQPSSQSKNRTVESDVSLSSSNSTFHERHQSPHQSQRGQRMSQSKSIAHSGPQWTSLQTLLLQQVPAPLLVASPRHEPRSSQQDHASGYPSNHAKHSHGQPASRPRKPRHQQRPGDSLKQQQAPHESQQSKPQYSPSM